MENVKLEQNRKLHGRKKNPYMLIIRINIKLLRSSVKRDFNNGLKHKILLISGYNRYA